MAVNTGKSQQYSLRKNLVSEDLIEKLSDDNLPSPIESKNPLDFTAMLNKATELLQDQALIKQDSDDVSLKDLTLTRAKVESFLDAINNVIGISHLNELLKHDANKFKREQELEAMNSILSSFNLASKAAEKNMEFLVKQLDYAIREMAGIELGGVDKESSEENKKRLDMVIAIQAAYGTALENLSKVTNGLTKIIQLERWSGGRQWGNMKSNTLTITNELMGNWNGNQRRIGMGSGDGNGRVSNGEMPKPRPLTAREIIAMNAEAEDDSEDSDF